MKDSNQKKLRKQWIELRTDTDRIEGLVFQPADDKGKRIADVLEHADRGRTGMLHLADATVYDVATGDVKFRKKYLAVNKAMILYVAPLSAEEALPKRVLNAPLAGSSTN